MLTLLKDLIPNLGRMEDLLIGDLQNVIGYHSTIFLQNGAAYGGGCGATTAVSRRVAVAECIERALFAQIQGTEEVNEFLIPEFPSTCGCAAGFDAEKTMFRAIFEAIERWSWSQWIDFGFSIQRVSVESSALDPYARYFHNYFDEVQFLRRDFVFLDPTMSRLGKIDLSIGIVLGIKDGGIFPGSRVAHANADIWQHGLVEAWRHAMIYKHLLNRSEENAPALSVIDQRILHFGRDKDKALRQIESARCVDWPSPQLRLLKQYNTKSPDYFLWRALCHNFIGWHEGPETRFVY
ncbi:hypothetical protein WDW86_12300 [Bdellovibrionota bacterium FG-2]